jgi:acyl-CoA synthetase (AMP-forming)/AMP-acid ligase II
MNVVQLLLEAAKSYPDRDALVSGLGRDRRSLGYGQLLNRVEALRLDLASNGLRPGDKVLLAVPLSIETYVALIAALSLGLVVMYVDPGRGLRAATRSLRSYPPRGILLTPAVRMLVGIIPDLDRIPVRIIVRDRRPRPVATMPPGLCVEPRANADGALLTFTSGSTGEPKAVLRSHGFLQQQLAMLQPLSGDAGIVNQVVTMPMFVLSNLVQGITSILPACDIRKPSTINFRILFSQLERECCNSLLAAPALVHGLVRHMDATKVRLPALQEIATGGGPVPLTLPAEVGRVAPGCVVKIVYGSTEAEPIATLSSVDITADDVARSEEGGGLLVGTVVPGCELAILRDIGDSQVAISTPGEFADRRMPAGKVGEVVVSGRHVLEGYLDSSHNSDNKIRVGMQTWHRTGDAGYLDHKGRLWLVGRCKAAIRDSWRTVYPFEVEIPACKLPGVVHAALLKYGEQPTLVLQTRQPDRMRDLVSRWVVLKRVRISSIVAVREIPMDKRHNSKVDYGRLEKLLDGQLLPFRERCLRILEAVRRAVAMVRRCLQLRSVRNDRDYRISRR